MSTNQPPVQPPAQPPAQPTAQTPAPAQAQPQSIPAVGFLVIAFTDVTAADQALDAMKAAKKQQQFYFEDAAVITQDLQGKVKYHETGDMSTGKGAGIGALVGGVLGILAGPAGVVVGAGAGAAVGAAIGAADKGFRNESLGTIGGALMPGTSAVAVITSHDFLKAVQQAVAVEDLRTIISDLASDLSAQLAMGKSVAIGLLLTEDGLAIEEVAADAVSETVVSEVITGDAVVAGAAVATADGAAYEVVGGTVEGVVAEAGVTTDAGTVVADAVTVPADPPAKPDGTKA